MKRYLPTIIVAAVAGVSFVAGQLFDALAFLTIAVALARE